eukprot:403346846
MIKLPMDQSNLTSVLPITSSKDTTPMTNISQKQKTLTNFTQHINKTLKPILKNSKNLEGRGLSVLIKPSTHNIEFPAEDFPPLKLSKFSSAYPQNTQLKDLIRNTRKNSESPLKQYDSQKHQQYQYTNSNSQSGNSPKNAQKQRSLSMQSNYSRSVIKRKLEEKKIEVICQKLSGLLLLKNNIKGTETKGFRKNKDINEKWENVIEDICVRRETKQKQDIKNEQFLKEISSKWSEMEKQKKGNKPRPRFALVKPPQNLKASLSQAQNKFNPNMPKKNTEFSLFKILRRHSKQVIGDPLTQVVSTLQDVAARENKLEKNPNLKFKYNQYTGDQYILKIQKQKRLKKKKSSQDLSYTQPKMQKKESHFLDKELEKKKNIRNQLLGTVKQIGVQKELDLSYTSDSQDEEIDLKKLKKPRRQRTVKKIPSYMRQSPMKKESVTEFMRYFSSTQLNKDMFRTGIRQQTLHKMDTEFLEEEDSDHEQQSHQRKKSDTNSIKNLYKMKKFENTIFQSIKRDKSLSSDLQKMLQSQIQMQNPLYRGDLQDLKIHPQTAKAITDRLAIPRIQHKPQFFGLPKIQQEDDNTLQDEDDYQNSRPKTQLLRGSQQQSFLINRNSLINNQNNFLLATRNAKISGEFSQSLQSSAKKYIPEFTTKKHQSGSKTSSVIQQSQLTTLTTNFQPKSQNMTILENLRSQCKEVLPDFQEKKQISKMYQKLDNEINSMLTKNQKLIEQSQTDTQRLIHNYQQKLQYQRSQQQLLSQQLLESQLRNAEQTSQGSRRSSKERGNFTDAINSINKTSQNQQKTGSFIQSQKSLRDQQLSRQQSEKGKYFKYAVVTKITPAPQNRREKQNSQIQVLNFETL